MTLILSQGFYVGPLFVHWYGLTMSAAIVAAYAVARLYAERAALVTREQLDDVVFYMVIAGLVGARLYHVLSSGTYYFVHPVEILEVWNGGLGIYGGVALGAAALWWYCRSHKVSFGSMADIFAVALPIAQAIGRLGNFFNYEAFGYPTNLPWKMFVPFQFRPERYADLSYFHPTFAYEMLWDLAVFASLALLSSKRGRAKIVLQPGTLTLWYLILYSVGRFFIEALRIDSTFIAVGDWAFRLNQGVSLLIILAASGILVWRRKKALKAI